MAERDAGRERWRIELAALRTCPRCGYDLSGIIPTWTNECPLDGRCSECGIEFRWADLLNPRLRRLPWLYEHAMRWWSLASAWKTAFAAIAPWSFWRRIKVHHQIHPIRLTLWLPLTIASLLLVLSVVLLFIGVIAAYAGHLPLPTTMHASAVQLNHFSPIHVDVKSDNSAATITLNGQSASVPLHFQLTHDPNFVSTPIGDVLVTWRGNVGGWFAPVLSEPADPHSASAGPAFARDTIIAPNGDVFDDLIILTFVPPRRWAPLDTRTVILESVTNPYVTILGFPGLFRFIHFKHQQGLDAAAVAILVTIGFSGVASLIVLAAPSEWQRKSVRIAHLYRMAAYSFAPVPIIAIGVAIAHVWNNAAIALWLLSTGNMQYPGAFRPPTNIPPVALASLTGSGSATTIRNMLLLWLPMHWWFGLSRGMKLERPILLFACVSIAGILGVLVVLKFISIDWDLLI